ncbi:MAG TPA: hypothetical protein VN695_14505 [Streptosporangiaceae bacterium]|nr:hypothetical protein [Streptosporangiaceae bacterium]
MTNSRSLETLTAEDFLDVKGSRFQLTIDLPEPGVHATFQLELADVTQAGAGRSDSFRQPFTLLFHGPIEPVLPQGIYRLEHHKLGVLELFIVPVGPDESPAPGESAAMRYEAVFG